MSDLHRQIRKLEEMILGSALVTEEAAMMVAALPEDTFLHEEAVGLYGAIKAAVHDSVTPDPVTIAPYLPKHVSPDYIASTLCDHLYSSGAKEGIPQLVRARHQLRISKAADAYLSKASKRLLSPDELRENTGQLTQACFEQAVSAKDTKHLYTMKEVMAGVLGDLEKKFRDEMPRCGVETGLRSLDLQIGGFEPGDLAIIAARPSMGKTALLFGVATNAIRYGAVVVFSIEMIKEQLGTRVLSSDTHYDLWKLRTGKLMAHELELVSRRSKKLAAFPIHVCDSGSLTPMEVLSMTKQFSIEHKRPPALICIDYLQLMAPSTKQDSREREIASITRDLKGIAKDLKVPIVVACQLNRKVEERQNKRPILSDLRESGAIEQDADVVIGLYRPYPYTMNEMERNEAEAIVLKQRNGPVGTVKLTWIPHTATFQEVI